MKPTNVTGYPFSNGDRLTAISVNQICNALDSIQDYNDTIKEFEDLVEENTEEIKNEINNAMISPESAIAVTNEMMRGKSVIAKAINDKGYAALPTDSYDDFAEDITNMPLSEAELGGIETVGQFNVLRWLCNSIYKANTVSECVKSIDDITITEINVGYSFTSCAALQSVTMNALITISGASTFAYCSSLQSVTMNALTTISGSDTFRSCSSLQSVTMNALTTISNGYTFQYCSLLQSVTMNALTTISGANTFQYCYSLQSVTMNALTTISNGNTFQYCSLLQSVTMNALVSLQGNSIFNSTGLTIVSFPVLKEILSGSDTFANTPVREFYTPELTQISSTNCLWNTSLEIFYAPKLTILNAQGCFRGVSSLREITFGTLTALNVNLWNNQPYLRSITIGQDTDINLQFQTWTATNVIAEGASGITELNDNLYNNLLTKLYDHSNDGQTRTLRIGWLANVTAANVSYANAKGWTLTT